MKRERVKTGWQDQQDGKEKDRKIELKLFLPHPVNPAILLFPLFFLSYLADPAILF